MKSLNFGQDPRAGIRKRGGPRFALRIADFSMTGCLLECVCRQGICERRPAARYAGGSPWGWHQELRFQLFDHLGQPLPREGIGRFRATLRVYSNFRFSA